MQARGLTGDTRIFSHVGEGGGGSGLGQRERRAVVTRCDFCIVKINVWPYKNYVFM